MRDAVALPLVLAVAAVLGTPAVADPPARPKSLGAFELSDVEGNRVSSAGFSGRKALVLLFTSTQCPECQRCLPQIAAVAKDYASREVAVLAVNPNGNEQGELEAWVRDREVPFPTLRDGDHGLADRLGIEITPTVLVADAAGDIRYRGRVDSSRMGEESTGADLRAALDAVLDGREVATPETPAAGCAVRRREIAKTGDVTWSKHVAPIVFENCAGCHRPGNIGPMPLTDFAHASAFAEELKSAVTAKRMPPWKPVAGQEFIGERRLTREQIDLIVKWVDGGTPEGDPKEEPELPEFPDGWAMGEPDMVLDAGADFDVKPGPDLYWHFVMPTKWTEDKWVAAVEVRPGNRRIVHHVLGYIDQTGMADRLDEEDGRLGYKGSGAFPGFVPTGEMGGWTPGFFARPLPDGVARKLAKNARLVIQVHYNNPTGKAHRDRTQVGLYFAKTPVKRQLYQARILNPWFKLPAGDGAHEVQATWPVNRDITVISVMPHCHLLGKEARMVAELPKGGAESLVEIADWDFKWQDTYVLKNPLRLPSGTRIRLTMVYDNSEKNPRNPFRPPREVRWGEKTTEEMCLGYVNYVRNGEDLTKPKKK
ncbi:MAG: redoxin domain-containing protein [Planctomycetes bacterium]|nr:redoxin domain-containing protein [Planctomycetota bacterium]